MNIRHMQKVRHRTLTIYIPFMLLLGLIASCKSTSLSKNNSSGLIPLSALLQSDEIDKTKLPKLINGNLEDKTEIKTAVAEMPPPTAQTGMRRLPTLREQMNELARSQEQLETKQDSMFKKLQEFDEELNIVKQTFLPADNNTPTGSANIAKSKKTPSPQVKDNTSTLLSDEESTQQPVNKKSAANRRKTMSDSKPVVLQKDESIKSSDEAIVSKAKTSEKIPSVDSSSLANPLRSALRKIAKKNYVEAIPLLELSIASEKSPIAKGNAHYWLGESYYAQEKYELSIEQFDMVEQLKNTAKMDDALLMKAEAYIRLNKVDLAKQTYQRLINTFPNSEFVPRAKKQMQLL